MHGLVNRALQRFSEDVLGSDIWASAADATPAGRSGFEAMLTYDDDVTDQVLDALSQIVGAPRAMLLEDLGSYLVSHPNTNSLRRLLRFGGDTYTDFLYSLDELPDRVRLAVSDLVLPRLDLFEHGPTRFTLSVGPGMTGIGHVLLGVLRAMADDYGALAVVEVLSDCADGAQISVHVAEVAFSEGRGFDLAQRGAVP